MPSSVVTVTLFMALMSARSKGLSDMVESASALCNGILESAAEQFLSCQHWHIAERVGYVEPTSVIHAFKRRKGCTPNAFRLESPIDVAS